MSQWNGTKDKDATQSFAHQKNIERYRKLLRTYLTDIERLFVQRRLAEEQAALRHLGMADVLSQVGLWSISEVAVHK